MIKIETKKGEQWMTKEEFSRWLCLVEAFHYIEQKSDEMNVDSSNMIKTLFLERYVDERYLGVLHDVNVEHEMGIL